MIVAHQLSKLYGSHAAVDGCSLRIDAGEVVALLGLNGAGKTTLLRLLSGLLLPSSGWVEVDGLNLAEQPDAARRRIGFAPETPPLYPEMTPYSFLSFVARIKSLPSRAVHAAVQSALGATDLLDAAQARISTLSSGYQRRVGIAQAIVHRPALVLLDEPTSGLDPVQIVHMRQLIQKLRGQHTVLVSSHLLSEVHQLCDRLFVLQSGRIAAEGTEAALAARLGGAVRVLVDVQGTAEALGAALAQLPAVSSWQLEPSEPGANWLSASISLNQDARAELAACLVGQGLGLRRLEPMQLELESIFLRLTEAPAPARAERQAH